MAATMAVNMPLTPAVSKVVAPSGKPLRRTKLARETRGKARALPSSFGSILARLMAMKSVM